MSAEQERLDAADLGTADWRAWGPYVAERAWGTVREDYSADGDAWASVPHDHARSRAYRWNEDGMAGFCDEGQDWCLALALWNGVDPILKERMFGLSGPEGNHGEDVKECWWYLDGTPTHSLNTWRYHYPQRRFPYADLVDTNAQRDRTEPEYELLDTGVFDDDRYWVVTVDYAKAGPRDLCLQITVENAGPDPASLDVLPTLWFRNRWSWGRSTEPRPRIHWAVDRLVATSSRSPRLSLVGDQFPEPLVCDNETNAARLFGSTDSPAFPTDGINDHVVSGAATVNPDRVGTKAALRYHLQLGPGERRVLRVRLTQTPADAPDAPDGVTDFDTTGFDATVATRRREADAFYADLFARHGAVGIGEAEVARQAFAGLLWSKQFYHYDVAAWLDGDPAQPPPPPGHRTVRNGRWRHLLSHDVILMPDPWEYPWFAAWDLAFHCVTLAHIDPTFAKAQLRLLLREWYQHPIGMMPAYEWSFGDVNPPVHAWAVRRVFEIDGGTDTEFLARVFPKLLMNFTWWLNAKDAGSDNLFGGGFLGLDNIAPLDRSTLPPAVGYLEQADATAWMAMYALDLLDLALILAVRVPGYEDIATTFFERFLLIAEAANRDGLWDEQDGYFYDRLHLSTGDTVALRVKSLVGLIPILASADGDRILSSALPDFAERVTWSLGVSPDRAAAMQTYPTADGGSTRLLAMVTPDRLRRILQRVLAEDGMLSPYGIRSISRWHRDHPFTVSVGGVSATVDYEPGESTSGLFGGNSNWRGPVWLPLNALLVESLLRYARHLGTEFEVELPTGSHQSADLRRVAAEISHRLIALFLPDADGHRPVHGAAERFATDPRWRDQIGFYEYFHGDNGSGLGASHQTGWTALVAHLILTAPR